MFKFSVRWVYQQIGGQSKQTCYMSLTVYLTFYSDDATGGIN